MASKPCLPCRSSLLLPRSRAKSLFPTQSRPFTQHWASYSTSCLLWAHQACVSNGHQPFYWQRAGDTDALLPLFHRYVSCALGCPYEGKVSPARVAEVCAVGPGLVRVISMPPCTHRCSSPPFPRRTHTHTVSEHSPAAPRATSMRGRSLAHLKAPAQLPSSLIS